MLGRVVAGTITSVALLCATIAWGGWVYLHTIGDPHRTEEIATAVLSNPAARLEIATVLADQIVERTGLPAGSSPTITTAVANVLGDDRIAGNLIDAFGSEHARALGVDDPRPTSIDTAALLAAVREQLVANAPQIATMFDTVMANVEAPDLTLPDLHTDAAGRFRDIAQKTTTTLGILAVILLFLAFAVGDRRHVLRRFGTWAIFSGIGWLAGPYLVAAIAKQFASDLDATIDAVRAACQGPVIVGAIVLVGLGVASLVLWALPIWPVADGAGGGPYRQPRAWTPRAVARRQPAGYAPDPAVTGMATATYATTAPAAARHTPGPVDTFVRSDDPYARYAPQPPYPVTQQAPVHQSSGQQPNGQQPLQQQPVAQQPATGGPPTSSVWAATTPAPEEQDPWAMYFDNDRR